MREKMREKKKEMVADGEPEVEKEHTPPRQVGTTERIPSLPWKPPFGHISWPYALPQIFWSPTRLHFNNLNYII
jgi:hypothetical protein